MLMKLFISILACFQDMEEESDDEDGEKEEEGGGVGNSKVTVFSCFSSSFTWSRSFFIADLGGSRRIVNGCPSLSVRFPVIKL